VFMLNTLDNYYLSLLEPEQSCLLFLRKYLLGFSPYMAEHWKYSTPFFYYKNKWLCYFSINKKTKQAYIGFVNGHKIKHAKLLSEGRKQIKVFYIDAEKDIDIKSLHAILKLAVVI
jgi:hypothetical protein